MDVKFYLALLCGKAISLLLSSFGKGATAAPGFYAQKLERNLLAKILQRNNLNSIIISGTNGKTTTARLLFDVLSSQYKTIHNRQGSNLIRGITSTLIKKTNLFGQTDVDLAIWETDEAILPEALETIKPKTVILLNLFRDQLDRYGEVDALREKWKKAIATLSSETTIIANGDDPSIAFALKDCSQDVYFFGIEDAVSHRQISNVSDVLLCPNCSHRLTYKSVVSSHLGDYGCNKCGFKRPKLEVLAQNIKLSSSFSVEFDLVSNNRNWKVTSNLPGLFNVYNALPVFLGAIISGISPEDFLSKTKTFQSAFGRFQKLEIEGKKLVLFLIKNPTGANEIIKTISSNSNLNILVALNDKIADGKDVSWIWDTNWEALSQQTKFIATTGVRAKDMALRLKYAQFNLSADDINEDIGCSLKDAIGKLDDQDTLYLLATYTAMLELQQIFSKINDAKKWHEN